MKFGKYLKERKKAFGESWQSEFVDYKLLKQLLKSFALDLSLSSLPAPQKTDGQALPAEGILVPDFPKIVSNRLKKVQEGIETFLVSLDAEVTKCNQFYQGRLQKALKTLQQGEEPSKKKGQLQELVREAFDLEAFVFLNYTAVIKILKKQEKLTSLNIKESYLHRISPLLIAKPAQLLDFKKRLADLEAQTSSQQPAHKKQKTVADSESGAVVRTEGGDGGEKVLVTLSGTQGTGILNCAMGVVANYQCSIQDISFSRIEHTLTVGVLVNLSVKDIGIFRDFIEAGSKLEAVVNFDVQTSKPGQLFSLETAPYENRLGFFATMINENGIQARTVAELTCLLQEFKISVSRGIRLTKRTFNVLELKLSIPEHTDLDSLREKLFILSNQHKTDISLQRDNVYRKAKRVAVFDMDSTLIQQEVIDELARKAGVYEEVKKITEEAMRGELDFEQSLRKRVEKLQGCPATIIDEVRELIQFTDGAKDLCRCLEKLGFKLAVVSGGFIPLAKFVKEKLGLNYAFANELELTPDGKFLTGRVLGSVVDARKKAELLRTMSEFEGVEARQVVAVGDGANDLLMLKAAGLGIAFNAKPKVQKEAAHRINQKSLLNVLYLLGYSDNDIERLLSTE